MFQQIEIYTCKYFNIAIKIQLKTELYYRVILYFLCRYKRRFNIYFLNFYCKKIHLKTELYYRLILYLKCVELNNELVRKLNIYFWNFDKKML